MCVCVCTCVYIKADLSISHQTCVLSHQEVAAKEEDKGMAEAQDRPIQKGLEGQQRVLTYISVNMRLQRLSYKFIHVHFDECANIYQSLLTIPIKVKDQKDISSVLIKETWLYICQ